MAGKAGMDRQGTGTKACLGLGGSGGLRMERDAALYGGGRDRHNGFRLIQVVLDL